jgi:hypothetical protein
MTKSAETRETRILKTMSGKFRRSRNMDETALPVFGQFPVVPISIVP